MAWAIKNGFFFCRSLKRCGGWANSTSTTSSGVFPSVSRYPTQLPRSWHNAGVYDDGGPALPVSLSFGPRWSCPRNFDSHDTCGSFLKAAEYCNCVCTLRCVMAAPKSSYA